MVGCLYLGRYSVAGTHEGAWRAGAMPSLRPEGKGVLAGTRSRGRRQAYRGSHGQAAGPRVPSINPFTDETEEAMKAKTWLLSCVLAASMAGAVGGASAQTYVYSVSPVPPPSGASVAVVLEARDGEEVTATVQAYNAAGVLGDDARNVTVPGNGFVRLNNSDLALGHDTGARKVVVMAVREINVSAMRRIWGDHAVALPVHGWVTTAVPPGSTKPGIPTNLAAVANTTNTDGRIDLTWDAVDVSAVEWGVTYTLRYRAEGDEWTEIVVGNVTKWTFTGVAGNMYDIRIRANRSDGLASSDWSESVIVQARNQPPGPVQALHDSNGYISFYNVTSATSYELQYRRAVSGTSWVTADLGITAGRTVRFYYNGQGRDGLLLPSGPYQARARALRVFAEPGPWTEVISWTIVR